MLRRDIENHLVVCHNRQCECPHCKVTGRYCDITTTHLDTCPKVKIHCSNEGCKEIVDRCELSEHFKTCEHALIFCPNKCNENKKEPWIKRCDRDKHLQHCLNRQHQCRKCDATGRYCDITTSHLDTCPNIKVPCPNSECWVSIPHCKLSSHRSTCEFEIVPCKYAGIVPSKVLYFQRETRWL